MSQDVQSKPNFVAPVATAPKLYSDDVRTILKSLCTPLDAAKTGDIIGGTFDFVYTKQGRLVSSQSTQLLWLDPNAGGAARFVNFTDLPEQDQAALALPCMKLQCASLSTQAMLLAADALDPGDREDLDLMVIAMADMSVMSVADYAETVLEGRYYDKPLDQEQINQCLRVLIPEAITSNHQLIAYQPELERTLKIVNMVHKIHDRDNDPTTSIQLGLPNPAPLIEVGFAAEP